MQNKEHLQSPPQLKSLQEWFASIITHPLGKNETIRSRTPRGALIAKEAADYIVPRPHLAPHQRIQIYNQQYWWRLFNTLHANFPIITRLFGYQAFNDKIAVPYLTKYPPNHWSINCLGKRLPHWLEESYKAANKSLVINSAYLDWAFMENLVMHKNKALDLSDMIKNNQESLLTTPFYLQPHITLFSWEFDLLAFREKMLEEQPDYWSIHCLPAISKGIPYFIILYRNANDNLAWRQISLEEFTLLKRFEIGSTMQDACDYIESQEACMYDTVAENLEHWLQEWTQAGWLTLEPRK